MQAACLGIDRGTRGKRRATIYHDTDGAQQGMLSPLFLSARLHVLDARRTGRRTSRPPSAGDATLRFPLSCDCTTPGRRGRPPSAPEPESCPCWMNFDTCGIWGPCGVCLFRVFFWAAGFFSKMKQREFDHCNVGLIWKKICFVGNHVTGRERTDMYCSGTL